MDCFEIVFFVICVMLSSLCWMTFWKFGRYGAVVWPDSIYSGGGENKPVICCFALRFTKLAFQPFFSSCFD